MNPNAVPVLNPGGGYLCLLDPVSLLLFVFTDYLII